MENFWSFSSSAYDLESYRELMRRQQEASSAANPPAAGAPAQREEQRLPPPPPRDNAFNVRALREALPGGSQSARYSSTRIDRVHTPPPDYDSMLRTPVDELTHSVERESASPPPQARPGPSQSMRLPRALAAIEPRHPFFPAPSRGRSTFGATAAARRRPRKGQAFVRRICGCISMPMA